MLFINSIFVTRNLYCYVAGETRVSTPKSFEDFMLMRTQKEAERQSGFCKGSKRRKIQHKDVTVRSTFSCWALFALNFWKVTGDSSLFMASMGLGHHRFLSCWSMCDHCSSYRSRSRCVISDLPLQKGFFPQSFLWELVSLGDAFMHADTYTYSMIYYECSVI